MATTSTFHQQKLDAAKQQDSNAQWDALRQAADAGVPGGQRGAPEPSNNPSDQGGEFDPASISEADLDAIDVNSFDFDGGDGDGEGGEGGGEPSLTQSNATAEAAALAVQLERERLARERLEGESTTRKAQIEALEAKNRETEERLATLQRETEAANIQIELTPPQALIDAIGEEAAAAQYEPIAQQLRESRQATQALQRQNEQILDVLKKAGVTGETSIDQRIDERVTNMTKAEWDAELHKAAPRFTTELAKPDFQAWAKATKDGPNSIFDNIVTCVKRRGPGDQEYCVRALKLRALALGKPIVGKQPSASRGASRGPARQQRDESATDARKRKEAARFRTAGIKR